NTILLILLLLLSAFFSSAEVAFVTLTEAKVEAMVRKKLPRSRLVKQLKRRSRRLLVTILVGNNIVNIWASSLATIVAIDIFDSAAVGIATGAMTLLILMFGEIIPKAYAANHPQTFAVWFSVPLRIFQLSAFPIIVLFEWMTNLVAGKYRQDKVSEEELLALAKASTKQGNIEHSEGKMIERLFAFNDITAEDIMTPRVQVAFLNNTHTIDEATNLIKNHPYTRYPVMANTPDTIIGYVHSRDVLLAYHTDKEEESIENIMHTIFAVPRQMRIDDLMVEFQKRKTHIAIVVDEFGGTEGVVTFEDIIEELVGEIADEHDIGESVIKRIDKDSILVAGDTTIREINDFFNVVIPGNELDTIAEVLLDDLQKIPRKGQQVTLGKCVCTVVETKKRRIQRVQIDKGL
ncbi:MAG: hypothetical protein COU30_05680, partial [Candidatus Magasanikbacteria bacterium CG10_big_fil_rev_8_21_14_0_10_38_6]